MTDEIEVGDDVTFRVYPGTVTEERTDGGERSLWVEFDMDGVQSAWFPEESLDLNGGDSSGA